MSDLFKCRFGSRVFQMASAPGKGNFVPAGDNLCGQTFAQAFSAGDQVYYTAHTCLGCAGGGESTTTADRFLAGQFEIGCATWDGSALVRDETQIEASSNGGQAVDFGDADTLVEATLNADFLRALCACIKGLTDKLACAAPVGQIMEWPWPSPPPGGWLPMDGVTAYSAAVYADLLAVGAYPLTGGTFKIPNLFGGRSPLGSGAGIANSPASPPLTVRARGTLGGEEETLLSPTQIPEHFHYLYTDEAVNNGTALTANDYVARSNKIGNSFAFDAVASSPANASLPSVGRTGSSGAANPAAHNTMHPFYVVDYYVWSGVC